MFEVLSCYLPILLAPRGLWLRPCRRKCRLGARRGEGHEIKAGTEMAGLFIQVAHMLHLSHRQALNSYICKYIQTRWPYLGFDCASLFKDGYTTASNMI